MADPRSAPYHDRLTACVGSILLVLILKANLPGEDKDPLLGSWHTTSIVSHDGTTVTPTDLVVTFTKGGEMTVRLGAMGSTQSSYRVLRHERHATVLKIVTNGTESQASVEFLQSGMTMLSNGTTMFMSHVDPAAPKHLPPPPPPPSAYQLHGLEKAASGIISGTMNGHPWRWVVSVPNLLQDSDSWRINLLAEPARDDASERLPQLLVSVPKVVGRRTFSDAFNATVFVPPSINVACGNGYVEVISISDHEVVFAINAYLNGDNHLNGTCTFDPRTIPPP